MAVQDKVSIITAAYNSSKFIAQCIESVIAQTYPNWEMIITDDASTDDTCRIVQEYINKDSRIKLLQLASNAGAGASRNKSLDAATGRYIAFLDSDDRWYPHKLERQLKFMKENAVEICYSSYDTCDENGRARSSVRCLDKVTYKDICRNNWIGFLTMIYDTERCGKLQLPMMRRRQDWGMMIELMQKIPIAYGIKEPLAVYRFRKGSISHAKLTLVKYNVEIYHRMLGYSYPKAWIAFLFVFMPTYAIHKLRL